MGLFNKFISKNTSAGESFSITIEDKKWVDSSFKWLIQTFGYPAKGSLPYLFNEESFPVTFTEKKISVEHLLIDLCNLYSIDRTLISFTLITDIRDVSMTPYEIQGRAFESELDFSVENSRTHYNIHIANNLLGKEYLLLRRLILELTKVKLNEKKPNFVANGNGIYFSYLASIYFGFGVLISKALVEVGVEYKAGWQKTWRTKSEVPFQIVSYALANYSKLIDDETPIWKKDLPADVIAEFDLAMQYLLENPDENTIFNEEVFENEIKAREHQDVAKSLMKSKQFNEAIIEYDLAIPLVIDKDLLSLLYLNTGYAYIRLGEYENSLPSLIKSLELRPYYGYPLNNMGFAYIMLGQLEKGKECLDKVADKDNILEAYSLRNYGVYYLKKENILLAEYYFKKAFEMNLPVDLLEDFYSQLLVMKNNSSEDMERLPKSVQKGETEGIELSKRLSPPVMIKGTIWYKKAWYSLSNFIVTITLLGTIQNKIIKRSSWYKKVSYIAFGCFAIFLIWKEVNNKRAENYCEKALNEVGLKNYQQAIIEYNQAIEIKPNEAILYSLRGLSKYYLNDYKGALQDCDKAIKLDKNYANAYDNRALAKNYLNDYQGAIQDCYKAIGLNKRDVYVYANLGYARLSLKDYKGAIQAFDSAIEFQPNQFVYFNRGLAKVNSGDKTGACLDFNKAKELGNLSADTAIKKYCQ